MERNKQCAVHLVFVMQIHLFVKLQKKTCYIYNPPYGILCMQVSTHTLPGIWHQTVRGTRPAQTSDDLGWGNDGQDDDITERERQCLSPATLSWRLNNQQTIAAVHYI